MLECLLSSWISPTRGSLLAGWLHAVHVHTFDLAVGGFRNKPPWSTRVAMPILADSGRQANNFLQIRYTEAASPRPNFCSSSFLKPYIVVQVWVS